MLQLGTTFLARKGAPYIRTNRGAKQPQVLVYHTGSLAAITCIGNPFSARSGCAPVKLAAGCGNLAAAAWTAGEAAGAPPAAVEVASAPRDADGCFFL